MVDMRNINLWRDVSFSVDHAFIDCPLNYALAVWNGVSASWDAITDDRIKVDSSSTQKLIKISSMYDTRLDKQELLYKLTAST